MSRPRFSIVQPEDRSIPDRPPGFLRFRVILQNAKIQYIDNCPHFSFEVEAFLLSKSYEGG